MELKHDLEFLFSVLCECDSLPRGVMKNSNTFCLFMKKYFLWLNILLNRFYFYEDFGRKRGAALLFEDTPKPPCLASSHTSRWFISWYSMLLTVWLTVAMDSPLLWSSMRCCLQACGSNMHALMKHAEKHTVTLFQRCPHACAKRSRSSWMWGAFWPVVFSTSLVCRCGSLRTFQERFDIRPRFPLLL